AGRVCGQRVRSVGANAEALAKKKDAIGRFMQAYRETIAYMYANDTPALKDYAEFAGVSEATARKARDEFFPRALVEPDAIHGIDSLMSEAVTLKFIPQPLTKEQLAELMQIQKGATACRVGKATPLRSLRELRRAWSPPKRGARRRKPAPRPHTHRVGTAHSRLCRRYSSTQRAIHSLNAS